MHSTVWCGFLPCATVHSSAVWLLQVRIGKFYRSGFGIELSGKWAWFVFESVSPVAFIASLVRLDPEWTLSRVLLALFWTVHYFNRAIVYPLRAPRMSGQSLVTALMACLYNGANGYVNGTSLGLPYYTNEVVHRPHFMIGSILFVIGMTLNITSDTILFSLRSKNNSKNKTKKYSIPYGGLFQYVSCPHYFGEIIEWTGYAIASWNLAGLSFACFTAMNLVPRGISTHQWYLKEFGKKYPARKAVIPFVL